MTDSVAPTSALLGHCISVYQAMYDNSVPYLDTPYRIWDGFSTHLVKRLNLSVPYYTKCFTALKVMDCVRQIRRGGSTTTSQWLLLRPPDVSLFEAHVPATKQDMQGQQLRDLRKRVQELEDFIKGA